MCSRSYWHFGRSMVREGVNKNRKIFGNRDRNKKICLISHLGTLKLRGLSKFQDCLNSNVLSQIHVIGKIKSSILPLRQSIWLFGCCMSVWVGIIKIFWISKRSDIHLKVHPNWEKGPFFSVFVVTRSLRRLFQILICKRSRYWNNFVHMCFFWMQLLINLNKV